MLQAILVFNIDLQQGLGGLLDNQSVVSTLGRPRLDNNIFSCVCPFLLWATADCNEQRCAWEVNRIDHIDARCAA